MKKLLSIVVCGLLMLVMFSVFGFAEDVILSEDVAPTEENQNIGQPKLIVTDYKLAADNLAPGKDVKLSVTVQNTHKTADIANIKLIFAAPDGSILPSGTDSVYIEKLGHGEKYVWSFAVTAAASAESGKHAASIAAEYETVSGEPCSASSNITLSVYNPPKAEPTENLSQPRLMVTAYAVENDYVMPGESAVLKITIKNTNKEQSVKNIKLNLIDDSGDLRFDGMGSTFVDRISAGGSYVWETSLTAVNNASVGEHNIAIMMEYESASGGYSASDTLRVTVQQTVNLDFDGATLPAKVVQGDTVTVSINLMNTGKSGLHNCKVGFEIDNLRAGGTSFAGDIMPGESKSVGGNLRVSSDFEGDTSGKIIITYEDDFGNTYEKPVDVSTLIEKKVEQVANPEETEKKNSLWWLFILIGLLVGGGAGVGAVFAVFNAKQRREDEKRL